MSGSSRFVWVSGHQIQHPGLNSEPFTSVVDWRFHESSTLLLKLTMGIDSRVVRRPTRNYLRAPFAQRDRLMRKFHRFDFIRHRVHTLRAAPTARLYLRPLRLS